MNSLFSVRNGLTVLSMPFGSSTLSLAQTASGPSAQSTTLTDLVMKYDILHPNAKFNQSQSSLLRNIIVHQDRQYKNIYYYVLPMSLRQSPNSGRDWSETLNPQVFSAIFDIDKKTRELSNAVVQLPSTDMMNSPAKKALVSPNVINKDVDPTSVEHPSTTSDVYNALMTATKDLPDATKQSYVNFVALELARAGRTTIPNMTFSDAIQFFATMVKSTAVVNVDIPVGFGFDHATATAFRDLRAGLTSENLQFYELPAETTWQLRRKPVASDAKPGDTVADNVYAPSITSEVDIFTNYNGGQAYPITSSGGVMTVALNYAGALGYGYGSLDSSTGVQDVDNDRINIAKYIPGFLTQDLHKNVSLSGKAVCKFKADVNLRMPISLKKSGGIVVPLSTGNIVDSGNKAPEINDCQIFDETGAPANLNDPAIANLVESFKAQHKAEQLTEYNAALSIKDQIRQKAQNDANGWRYLPMPTETRLVHSWDAQRVCRLERTSQYCAQTTTRSAFGIPYKTSCTRWDWNVQNVCSDFWFGMDRLVKVDAPVAYFSTVAEFEKVWDRETTYAFSNSTPVIFPVSASNLLCIARNKASGQPTARGRCDGMTAEVVRTDRTDDMSSRPNPTTGAGALERLGDGPGF